jgi:hypothetical protein
MFERKPKTAYILSIVIVILMILATVGGLFLNRLYRDNDFVIGAWRANDLVTLVVAVPVLIMALAWSNRDSTRAQLVWLGMLDYALYNYAFYLFAAAFNWFFLVYVALFTLSIFALIFGLVNVDTEKVVQKFREQTPVKWIAGYMLFVALGLTAIYFIQAFGFIFTDQLPEIVTKTGHPTSVVPALDLSFVVSWLVLGAVWLWQRRPWGYVISAAMVVKGAVYTLVLTVVTVSSVRAGFSGLEEIPIWGFLCVGFLLASLVLLVNVREVKDQ